eukprot:11264461-Karenia_brevis.AAC.1
MVYYLAVEKYQSNAMDVQKRENSALYMRVYAFLGSWFVILVSIFTGAKFVCALPERCSYANVYATARRCCGDLAVR